MDKFILILIPVIGIYGAVLIIRALHKESKKDRTHPTMAIVVCLIGAAISLTAASIGYLREGNISGLLTYFIYLIIGIGCVALITLIIRRKLNKKWEDQNETKN